MCIVSDYNVYSTARETRRHAIYLKCVQKFYAKVTSYISGNNKTNVCRIGTVVNRISHKLYRIHIGNSIILTSFYF